MEQQSPSWLDERFLEQVLQGGEDKSPKVTIINFNSETAVPPGQNYNGQVLRVHVNYTSGTLAQEESITLIIKTPYTEGLQAENIKSMDLYGNERSMYDKVLGKVYEKTGIQFAPKSYYCPLNKGLVLKDLSKDGYVVCDRTKQLDYSHCKQLFEKIAIFHATSVACYHDDPSFIRKIGEERLYDTKSTLGLVIKSWIESCATYLAEYLIEVTGNIKLAKPLFDVKDRLWETAVKMCRPKEEGLNVLNHGDLWTTNMLFKYSDSQEVVDVKIIDYQMPRFASPVLDLVFFIWTSAREDVRENYQSDLFTLYHQTLNATLESLGCEERYSKEEMRRYLESAKDWALVLICSMLLLVILPPENNVPLSEFSAEDFADQDKNVQKICRGKHIEAILPGVMRQFNSWDTLSVLK